ncbi:Coenzyme F420 hydrogenase/dehydrogenase, beta subunit C-terminal domain [Butyrivibrio sp. FCS014]|uniref:Coenzyme F420 hydrogenase/dehydrogenase, beta subunit C-terminal domain n=1 Tax=Butyrivibrio sp. FCS014 TaxID=1408304 RepID=UPI0004655950|nr:Coenzyme F420 hydrogenase/dehydrogenase, beta subunit C-terminal domain [Butyrivibrio sp. FCS014]
MDHQYLEQTNILAAFAGFYKDDNLLLQSSSGGVATELSSMVIETGGVVYGATYSDDFYSAHYLRVSKKTELDRLKGSKYVFVEKKVAYGDEIVPIYEAVQKDVDTGRKVLFIGLSCDVAAVKKWLEVRKVDTKELFTVELLCDGVTGERVHENYIKHIEAVHNSKIVSFSVRNKRDGWVPLYIWASFENGEEHIVPFYDTAYGYAFLNYKKRTCYECRFKKKNRYADITIGDYWGCDGRMNEYNPNGVSIIYVQTEKGLKMLDKINSETFTLMETDAEFALRNSPRYFDCHPSNNDWISLDNDINSIGLHNAVRKRLSSSVSERSKWNSDMNTILWGTGKCFHELAPIVIENTSVKLVVDSNPEKWGRLTEIGIPCDSPECISKLNNVFVIIMIENASTVCQVIQGLLDLNVNNFDQVKNWLTNYV